MGAGTTSTSTTTTSTPAMKTITWEAETDIPMQEIIKMLVKYPLTKETVMIKWIAFFNFHHTYHFSSFSLLLF